MSGGGARFGYGGGGDGGICSCGHPVAVHELLGTEYCRCNTFPGECQCSGGERAVLRVAEPKKRSGLWRFFRRQPGVKRAHPLNAAIERVAREGVRPEVGGELEWLVEECDLCGEPWDGDFTAFWCGEGGVPVAGEKLTVEGLVAGWTRRSMLVCGLCCVELEWSA